MAKAAEVTFIGLLIYQLFELIGLKRKVTSPGKLSKQINDTLEIVS